jgi:PKD repeat protein
MLVLSLYNNNNQLVFEANTTAGTSPFSVIFDNQTPNLSDYNFTWIFGDGTVQQNNSSFVPHTYQYDGTWDVTLIAENIVNGCLDTLTQSGYVFSTGGEPCPHNAVVNQTGPIIACASDSVILSCNNSPNFSYQWQLNGFPINGSNDSLIQPTESGNYRVIITADNCPVFSEAIEVNLNSFTPPTISSDGSILPCIGGEVTLAVPDEFENYSWSNGEQTNSINITSSGNYFVTVTNNEGCVENSTIFIVNASSVPAQEICIITVDSTSQNNLVVWEKEVTDGIDSYLIYREMGTNNYVQIGNVPYDSLSQFLDTSVGVNPNITSYRYRISALDTCETETNLSNYHETMHLSINQGISGQINLIWDEYEGFPINYYYILRDSTFFYDNWEVIDSVSSNNFIYTDLNPPVFGANYIIEVIPPEICTSTRILNYVGTRSNIGSISISGSSPVAEFNASTTSVDQESDVNFFDQSTNEPTSWSWFFEGANPPSSNVENPTGIIYNNEGFYNVTLIVSNSFGVDSIIKTNYITVNNSSGAPNCAFIASETQIQSGAGIDFLDQSSNNPTSWTWLFEGGTPSFSIEQYPTNIIYENAGFYDVTLIANNSVGEDTLIKTDYIEVQNGTYLIEKSLSEVSIYPNPSDGKVAINISGYSGDIEVSIYDLLGNLIQTTTHSIIEMDDYSNGIYLFKISYDNRVEEFKVIKN